MPRPRVPFVLDIENPMPFDEALMKLFAGHGFEFLFHKKYKLKNEMTVMFQADESSWPLIVTIEPTWKTNDEHDDRFYDAIVRALDDWIKHKRCRGFQLMARNMAALIPKLPGGTPGIYDFGRAAGNAICQKCGLEFVEHPMGLEEFLHLLCDGKQVKL